MITRLRRSFSSKLALLALAAALLVAACSSSVSSTPPAASSTPGCVTFPNELLESVSWSADGGHLALVSSVDVPGGFEDRISVLNWPQLTRSILYQAHDSLQEVAIDPKGQTAYFWLYSPESASIWSVNSGASPMLLGQTNTESTFSIYWRSDGIARLTTTMDSTSYLKVWLTGFDGKTSLIEQDAQILGALMTRDGQWLVELNRGDTSSYTNYKYTVVRAGTRVTVLADGRGELLGMTENHTAIVYRPADDDGGSGTLVIHVLPINGGPERVVGVPLAMAGPVRLLGLSDQGVLAYTDSKSDTSELCTTKLPAPQG